MPRSLSGSVVGVTGLDNAAPLLPLQRPSATAIGKTTPRPAAGARPRPAPCSFYYGEHYATGLPRQFGVTSFPTDNCGYSGTQLRKAYGASTAATGSGQTVALIELGLTPDMFLTLHDYARANGLPVPASTRYGELSLGRGSACGDPFDIEEQLDVEMSYAMAPAASQLVVGGDSCNQGDYGLQGLFDADLAVLGTAGHPLATVASNSWGSGPEGQAPALTGIEHTILVQAAAEGVGMYFSSGDGSGVAERPVTRTPSRSVAPPWASARAAAGCSKLAGPKASRCSTAGAGCSWASTAPPGAVPACSGPSRPTRTAWCPRRWSRRQATGAARSARCRTSAPMPTRSPGPRWAT